MAAVAHGFVIDGAPTERFTSNGGMEASVTFFGPAANRMLFLQYIFGRWDYENWGNINPSPPSPQIPDGICYSDLPKPFVSMSELSSNETHVDCFRPEYATLPYSETSSHFLWPDTWEIASADPNSRAEFVNCIQPGSDDPEERAMYRPIDYTCNCYVTVHYRNKSNGSWPISFQRYVDGAEYGGVPAIPPGTYIDVKTRVSGEVQTIEGQGLAYDLSSGATWETNGGAVTVGTRLPPGISVGSIVSTTQMDVTWSGVPFPSWSFIDGLQGRVNHEPFLGYPPESVCFFGAEWTTQGSFGGVSLYTIHYSFIIKTAQVMINSAPSSFDYAAAKMIPGTTAVGIWNRRANSVAIKYGNSIVTNYVPIHTAEGNKPPFQPTDTNNNFWHLFTMKNASGVQSNSASQLLCPGA